VSFRNFARLLLGPQKPRTSTNESLDSILRTVDDATHVQGRGPNTAGNSHVYRLITRGHKNYTASFKSKKRNSS